MLKKAHLKILADKPDIFACLPPEVLSGETIEQLRQIPRLAVAEIAGPADVPALRELLPHCRPDGLVPTFSYCATEFGDWEVLDKTAAALKKTMEQELRIYTAAPVVLGAPALWQALHRAHEGPLAARFGFSGRCRGCRLYSYLLRVPLCKQIDARHFIPSRAGLAGRGCPDRCLPIEKKYFDFLLSGYGIEAWHQPPLAADAPDGKAGPSCVLACGPEDSASPEALTRYFETFALPCAGGILSRAVFGATVDYDRIIGEAAMPPAAVSQARRSRGV